MLSMQKFSSNVIEKCMDRASEEVIVHYVEELADPAAMRPLLQVRMSLSFSLSFSVRLVAVCSLVLLCMAFLAVFVENQPGNSKRRNKVQPTTAAAVQW